MAIVACQSCTQPKCASSLRRNLSPSLSSPQIPLLGAEIDILMQRRNTKIGSMYETHDELYNQRLAQNAICGRADVETAIKAIQRFTLQRKLLEMINCLRFMQSIHSG
jgi:hypothetical protein